MSDDEPASSAEADPTASRPAPRGPWWTQRRNQVIAGGVAVVVVAVAAGVALSGGGDDDPIATSTTRERATTTSTDSGPTSTTAYAGPVAPLSGVADPDGLTQGRAALTVKIDNTLNEGPKRGVDLADVVYEEVVEGDQTRLAAIFQSQVPAAIGPIRSVRLTDQAIVRPIGGLFVFSGGAPYAMDSIETAPVELITETAAGDAMYRDGGRRGPYNLFGRGEGLFAFGGEPVPPPSLFEYRGPDDTVDGFPVQTAYVGFRANFDVTWTWDDATERWHRTFKDEQELVEGGAPIAPANVIVQFVDYTFDPYPEGQLTGSGAVWVLTDGKVVQGRWERLDADAPGRLVDSDGNPILLTPGQTWVELPRIGYEFRVG